MMVARWQFEARFGHKQTVIDLMKRWDEEFGSQIVRTPEKCRRNTGSIGALESMIHEEVVLKDLSELGAAWE